MSAPLADAFATLDEPARKRLMKSLLIVAGIMLAITLAGAWLQRNTQPELFPALTHVDLPTGQCGQPQRGDVLHITVAANTTRGQDFTITCTNAGPRPNWSGIAANTPAKEKP